MDNIRSEGFSRGGLPDQKSFAEGGRPDQKSFTTGGRPDEKSFARGGRPDHKSFAKRGRPDFVEVRQPFEHTCAHDNGRIGLLSPSTALGRCGQ